MINRQMLGVFALVLALLAVVVGSVAYFFLSVRHPEGTVQASPTPGQPANGCRGGITKNSDGSYSFSWLHVSADGKIVDEKGCVVPLVGFNMGGLFLADASGGTKLANIAWYKQRFPMNIVRVNFNSLWWVNDVYVPKANMHFRQWLQQYVKWQEQLGNYVELDKGPHFPEPPCGGTITYCPTQDQGIKDYTANPNPETQRELEPYISYDVQAWTDIAKIYANDPAVIYDAWNEPILHKQMAAYFQDMNTLINTIRAQNPRALIIVYDFGWKYIMSGQFPEYQQSNLVIDSHIYDNFKGISPATGKSCQEPGHPNWTPSSSGFDQEVTFAHTHGQAVIVNEWGGCYPSAAYNQQLVSFAKTQDVGLVYFQSGDVVNKANGTNEINNNGQMVQADYASILRA